MTTENVDLRSVVFALSEALDLVGVNDLCHGKRVGVMAAEVAQVMGWETAVCDRLFDGGLLHDCGVSSTYIHRKLVQELDWDGADEHCRTGAALLSECQPLADLAPLVRWHHTHWSVLAAGGCDPATALQANLIYLVDRADVLAAPFLGDSALLLRARSVRARLAEQATQMFEPNLVEAFLEASRHEAFWLQQEARSISSYLASMRRRRMPVPATRATLRSVAMLFSRVVDAKSRFTTEHSAGVARVACLLAGAAGLPPETVDRLEIAALLHDIGKLRIPDDILDKPGALTADERQIMASHSFESWQILRNIVGFEDIATWASFHHEEPDGAGYPFGIRGAELPWEARILRVADVFQAMIQDRPYRPPVAPRVVCDHIATLAQQGKVDPAALALLADNLDQAAALARTHADAPGFSLASD
jgi:HD-GYP domain-containing protein (c-di-GMP phosphodiesterase class II)